MPHGVYGFLPNLRGFLCCHARKETHFNQNNQPGILTSQLFECVVQVQNVARLRFGGSHLIGKFHAELTALSGLPGASVIHQNLASDASEDPQEMSAIGEGGSL